MKSESFPKLERVLRWEGAEWVIAGYVSDSPSIMKQGKARWGACEYEVVRLRICLSGPPLL